MGNQRLDHLLSKEVEYDIELRTFLVFKGQEAVIRIE